MRNRNRRESKKIVATSEIMELQRLLGYYFKDPHLLEEALTHPSHPSRPTYQRLEHLGDAALHLAFTKYLFGENPNLEPGPLSDLRSANVSTEKLARVAVRHNLYDYLCRNTPAAHDQMVEKFTQSVNQEDPAITAAAAFGGTTVKAPKVLADIVESIAGAVYIDTDYCWRLCGGASSLRGFHGRDGEIVGESLEAMEHCVGDGGMEGSSWIEEKIGVNA